MPFRRSAQLNVERGRTQTRAMPVNHGPPTYLKTDSERFDSRQILSNSTGLHDTGSISDQSKSISQVKGVVTCTKGLRQNAGFGMVMGPYRSPAAGHRILGPRIELTIHRQVPARLRRRQRPVSPSLRTRLVPRFRLRAGSRPMGFQPTHRSPRSRKSHRRDGSWPRSPSRRWTRRP